MEELLWGALCESESPGGSYSWGGIATAKMYWRREGTEYTLTFRLLPVSQWWNPIWGQQAREPVCRDQPSGAQNMQRKMENVFGGGKWTLPECLHQLKHFIILWSASLVCSVVSNSLWPHGLQHARLPCPSPTPGACSNACPSSWWCHPTILSSVVPFSSCLQPFPAPGSFSNGSVLHIRWLKYWP